MGRTVEVIKKGGPVNTTEPVVLQKKRVAAYCRVSTDLEEQQSSLQTQVESFQEQISTRPEWELVDVYSDEGLSGTRAEKRTEFLRMIADCDAGKIDYIITKSISRFARNTLECLSYVKHLKEKGVYIYFEKERLDTSSAASEMLLSIMAAVAQEESRNISENIKWSFRRQFAEGDGKWSAIYGYKKVGEVEYIIDEDAARIVRRIFNEYAHGSSLPEIIRGLEKDGIESPWGRSWAPTVLANMLRNEKYCGDVLIQKFYTEDHMSHKIIRNDQSLVPSYFIRDHHEPIVDRKTYDMVQIIRSLKDKHKGAVQYPYYGRLICPNCGEPMIRHCSREHGRPAIWSCISETEKCRKYFIREKYIDAAFIKAYRELDINILPKSEEPEAAQDAIKLKTEIPELSTVEYYILDALVDQITFRRWDVMEIEWTFGTTSKIQIEYECAKDIPNNKEQLDCVGIMSLSHTAEHSEVVPRYNSYKRPQYYGYDSIVPAIAEGGK